MNLVYIDIHSLGSKALFLFLLYIYIYIYMKINDRPQIE